MPANPGATLELNAVDNVTPVLRQIGGAVTTLQTQYEKLGGALRQLAGLFGIGMMGNMLRDTIAMEAEMARLAEKTGSTAEALSSLMQVAKLSHTDMDSVGTAMGKLARAMAEAEGGSGKASAVFQALGIALRDANTGALRPTQETMQELGQKLLAMKDQTLAVAFSQEVLGKNGAAMLPFLYELARAGELHAKFLNEQAEQAKKLEDNLVRLEGAAGKLKYSVANSLVPGLVMLTDNLVEANKQGRSLMQWLTEIAKLDLALFSRLP